MKSKLRSLLSLLIAALLLASAMPSPAHAEGGNVAGAVSDIEVSPVRSDGLLRFDETVMIDGKATTVADAIAQRCSDAFGARLSYVSYIMLSANQGTLYDGYTSEADTGIGVAGLQKYYYKNSGANYQLENIQFVPNASFTGRALISYYGYTGGAQSYAGNIYIAVGKKEPGITYSTDGEAVRFTADDFNTFSMAVTGRAFRFISFQVPSPQRGGLYYNYLGETIYDYQIESGNRFYRNDSPSMDNVYFVPNPNYAGVFSLPFSGIDTSGAEVSGLVMITVTNYGPGHPQTANDPFTYHVAPGESVYLENVSDFEDLCKTETGSDTGLSHIRFMSLPPSQEGRLYFGSSNGGISVSSTVSYEASNLPDICFTAHYDYEGTVTVPIRGYTYTDTGSRYFDATLRFVVEDGGSAPLHYTVAPGKSVFFEYEDFTAAARAESANFFLSRIQFTSLPPSAAGRIYYLKGNDVIRVTEGTDYSPGALSNMSFQASESFTGSVTATFTAYNYSSGLSSVPSHGRHVSGTVTITSTVSEEEDQPVQIGSGAQTPGRLYTWGPAFFLGSSGLLSAASASLPGAPATFRLITPDENAGRLCWDFSSPTSYSAFNARQTYPVSDLSRVSFLPRADYSGTVPISFTVSDASGNSYTGSMQIEVLPPARSTYFSDMENHSWAVPAADFFYYYGAVNGVTSTSFGPSSQMRRGDFILLLSRAYSFPSAGLYSFDDVPMDSYYAEAIASARALGIVTGWTRQFPVVEEPVLPEGALPEEEPPEPVIRYVTESVFYPDEPIPREEAFLYLYRCMTLHTQLPLGPGPSINSFVDAADVSPGAAEAVDALTRMGVVKGAYRHLYPASPLSRAETIVILHRALT